MEPPYFHTPTSNCSCITSRESAERAIEGRQLVRVCQDMDGPHVMIWKVRLEPISIDAPPRDIIIARHCESEMGIVNQTAAGAILMALTMLEE